MEFDYLKFFITGKKSDLMIDIEHENSTLGKFRRRDAIFYAIGNITLYFKHGWIMILPATHTFRYINNRHCYLISLGIISFYYSKIKISEQ